MSVLTHLDSRASSAILSDAENSSIQKSIATLSTRLTSYFGSALKEQFRFGSSTRGTILPRSMDSHSDIDYMIVLDDDGSTTQTYLDRVKRFAEKYYASSDIKQSSPSIVLELNHIKFDLVPAQKTYFAYKIVRYGNQWLDTDPTDFNSKLTAKNNSELYKIKPTIRLAKYWNALNNYPFDSYSFEKWIVDKSYYGCANQKDYFFKVIDELSVYATDVKWVQEKIQRAKDIVAQVRKYEADDMPNSAEVEIKKLIP